MPNLSKKRICASCASAKNVSERGDIAHEVIKTGKLLKAHAVKATQSKELKQVKKAADKTLNTLIGQLNKLIATAKKKNIEKAVAAKTLVSVQKINKELEKQLTKWK